MDTILSMLIALLLLLTGCGKADRIDTDTTLPPESPAATGSQVAVPEAIQEIPNGYFEAAGEQGTLEDLYYDTWESFSYGEKTQPLQKHAVIYLPYGYDESQSYNGFNGDYAGEWQWIRRYCHKRINR